MLDQLPSLLSQFGLLPVVGAVLLLWLGYKSIGVLIDEVIRPYFRLWHVRRAMRVSEEPKPPLESVLSRVLPPADNKPLIGLAELKPKLKP